MTDLERWASIPDAHNYLVSDDGNVRRMLDDGTWRTIRPGRNSKGYLKVCLGWEPCPADCDRHKSRRVKRPGHTRQEYVHRLVWMAFRGPIPDDMTVDHVDDDQVHNTLPNLQLLSDDANNAKRLARRYAA